jgi:hypothetical protein
MAIKPQSVLYRHLAEAYTKAALNGRETVEIHVTWISDILDYLDPTDATQTQMHKPHLDDQPTYFIENFIKLKEKENGPIF